MIWENLLQPLAVSLIMASSNACLGTSTALHVTSHNQEVSYRYAELQGEQTTEEQVLELGQSTLMPHFILNPQLELGFIERSDGVCVYYKDIKVEFIAKPSVALPVNYAPGSCEFKALLRHENKHARMVEEFQKAFLPALERDLHDFAQENVDFITIKMILKPDVIKTYYYKRFNKRMRSLFERITKEHNDWQAKLDTPEEHEKVRRQCSNW